MVFASHPRVADQTTGIAQLVDHACREVVGWHVDLAQALLDPGETLERRMFEAAGFQELAVLSYLERPVSKTSPPPAPRWPAGTRVRVEPYRHGMDGELGTILERSYEQTLDCPGLYGLRRTEDIIAGHKATGRFDPSLWTLLYVDDEPAGVILINPFPGHKVTELVYIGLAPFARGRGLGRQLLRHGLCLLQGRRAIAPPTCPGLFHDASTPGCETGEKFFCPPTCRWRRALARSRRAKPRIRSCRTGDSTVPCRVGPGRDSTD
jgi:GNAT superfamily N-acetyltransferase